MRDKDRVLAIWADVLKRWVDAEQALIAECCTDILARFAEVEREAGELDAKFRKALGL